MTEDELVKLLDIVEHDMYHKARDARVNIRNEFVMLRADCDAQVREWFYMRAKHDAAQAALSQLQYEDRQIIDGLRAELAAEKKACGEAEIDMVDMGNQLTAALEREKVLREAIEDIPEWRRDELYPHGYYCQWCGAGKDSGHTPDCLHQRALAQGGEVER